MWLTTLVNEAGHCVLGAALVNSNASVTVCQVSSWCIEHMVGEKGEGTR
ncbi:hypothetical protein [Paenibacillus silvae]|nr:hypothetical protein [Paenibacillus silvae]